MKQQCSEIVRVGVDLAKSVIQVHAVDHAGTVVVARQLQRSAFIPWCEKLPEGCIVGMEASSAHFWARELERMGLEPRLVSPSFVAPYRLSGKTGKTDANDAAAICEAVSRPHMRFVPVKTPAQQAWLALHSAREGYVKDRTACMNRVRGVLSEFGIIFPIRTRNFEAGVREVLAAHADELPQILRATLRRCLAHFQELEQQIVWCDRQVAKHVRSDPNARLAITVRGVGPLGASALVATVGNLTQFKNGRQFSAWLGLVPRQASSGGKQRLGSITKRGDSYLRRLLVIGASGAMAAAPKMDDAVSKWAVQLRARIGGSKAHVALANKNARILWRALAGQSEESADPRG